MKKHFAIAVHGGAGADSDYIRENKQGYEKGLEEAVNAGYEVLERGGSAVDAVEAAVRSLEDNPLFNAGKGSAINAKAEVEMCASIIRGQDQRSGAVAIVKNVRNPVSLARAVMEKTKHIYLGSHGALDFAKQIKVPLEPDSYFITEHQYKAYEEERNKAGKSGQLVAMEQINERMHGTVGAVALDAEGNLAAATSTGGTEFAKEGRIGDSSIIGVGSFADNKSCAISATGDGEEIIRYTTAFHVSALMQHRDMLLKEAADYFLNEVCKESEGDIGLVGVDREGEVSFAFNAERMHRGFRTSTGALEVAIYPGE
jgi:beta-aspartyl-peptidase (threonine type)